MLKADVVIASYNGGKRLGKTLDSFSRMATEMAILPEEWRLLLINNNSSDDTKNIALCYQDRLPLEIIDVTEPGKSVALNRAVAHFKAETIVFSDDDVEVAPDWLDRLLAAVDRESGYDVFAGRIVGQWEARLDKLLETFVPVGSTYAIHERDSSGPCDPGIVWGPNMAVRRRVFDAGHRYDERIGPQPKKLYPMGQDSEMAKRLFAAGHKSYFVAEAAVRHAVKKETVSEDWILRRAERLGYGIFAVKGGAVGYDRKFPSLPLKTELIFNRVVWTAFYPATFLMSSSKFRFWSKWKYFFYRGLLKSYREFGA